jgi:copper homeostasis protein CutC
MHAAADQIRSSAERIVQEIDAECARILEDGGKVTRFSIVG